MRAKNCLTQKLRMPLAAALLFLMQPGYSQGKDCLDYIITKDNDTLYGTFRAGVTSSYLMEVHPDATTDAEKYIKHSLKGIKGYRYNDFVSNKPPKDDGIYGPLDSAAGTEAVTLDDYVVTRAGDTLYGKVSEPALAKRYIITADGRKIKITAPEVNAFRKGNFIYELKDKPKAYKFDKEQDFLLVLFRDGKLTLYGYSDSSGPCYYLEKGGQLHFINSGNYAGQVIKLLGDNPLAMKLFYGNVYSYENLYLLVKFYSRYPSY
jgi:hypothetical protein